MCEHGEAQVKALLFELVPAGFTGAWHDYYLVRGDFVWMRHVDGFALRREQVVFSPSPVEYVIEDG